MKILLGGIWGLYNRGCEAIVWGTCKLLKKAIPNAEISVAVGYPRSAEIDRQRLHHMDTDIYPLVGKEVSQFSRLVHNFAYQVTRLPSTYGHRLPLGYPEKDWDVILEIGGDTYANNPLLNFHHDKWLMKNRGWKVGLWGMNLGPYNPKLIPHSKAREIFSSYHLITVRDEYSRKYLSELGVEERVARIADPSFEMDPQAWDVSACLPGGGGQSVVGLNLSPLAAKYHPKGLTGLIGVCTEIVELLTSKGFGMLLVPHCFPPACPPWDDDNLALRPVYEQSKAKGMEVGIIPEGISAREMKYIISQCVLFIGARMHSTIAAWSENVPVISLSYSQKSNNMSEEIYGHNRYSIWIPTLSKDGFIKVFDEIIGDYKRVKDTVRSHVNSMREHTRIAMDRILNILLP